ncbi:MAG: hypothetical protein M1832_004716 [Thelocarpon impressellum]|nr:MAG: hypothetical protein M1832_004716 [Thelocarpon impressellum]
MAMSNQKFGGVAALGLDNAAETVDALAQVQGITADEIALLRNANILLVTLKALASEVAKNLVLAGIGSLTIVDHAVLSEEDLCSQFFVTEGDVGKNRAEAAAPQIRKLNPRVSVLVDTEDISLKDPSFFAPFHVIIATELDLDTLSGINAAARLSGRPFYAAGTHGFYGYIFADLIAHDYVIERQRSNVPTALQAETATRSVIACSTKKENGKTIELVTKREQYSPLTLANAAPLPPEQLHNRRRLRQVTPLLTCLKALWTFQRLSARLPSRSVKADLELFTTLATEAHAELSLPAETLTSDFLRSFLHGLATELSPVAALLGGQLAQDAINVLGQREQPIQNWLLFDGEESSAPVYAMHPIIKSL